MSELGFSRIRTSTTDRQLGTIGISRWLPLVIFQASMSRPLIRSAKSMICRWDLHSLTEQDHETGLFRTIVEIEQDD